MKPLGSKLKSECEELFRFYKEVIEVHKMLKQLNIEYEGRGFEEYYTSKLQFYEKIIKCSNFEIIMHTPKIIRNRISLKKDKKQLEENKHKLKVMGMIDKTGMKVVAW